MALAAHTPSPNWGRWQQPQQQHPYVVIDHGMVPYDSRAATSAPLQRPIMAPEYVMSNTFTPANSPPMHTVTSSHFQPPASFGYGPYGNSPAPLPSPPYSQEGRSGSVYSIDQSRSPSIKREFLKSEASVTSPNPSAMARKITPNIVLNEKDKVEFTTDVDEMMKIIQSKLEPTEPVPKRESEYATKEVVARPAKKIPRTLFKKHICDMCHKAFGQKTHLDIHRRTHTGEKPFKCPMPGCKSRHNQLGNLKSHVRRHKGEKPYACEQCGKRFPQRGNLKSHIDAHFGRKRFYCILDKCNKQFSALGNLKAHQNKFHQETVDRLKQKFLKMDLNDANMSQEDRELFEHFAVLYKNSNKGIKGRGKRCKVVAIQHPPPAGEPAEISPQLPPMPSPHHHHHHHHHHPQQQHYPIQQVPLQPVPTYTSAGPYHNTTASVAPTSLPSPHNDVTHMYGMARYPSGNNYEMYKMEHDSVSGSTSTAPNSIYGEGQTRADEQQFSYGERMY